MTTFVPADSSVAVVLAGVAVAFGAGEAVRLV